LILHALTGIERRADAAMMRAVHLRIGNTLVSVFVFALLAATNIAGQTVIIRIVNVTNENPIRNQHVYIWGISGKIALEEDEQRERGKLLTNAISPELSLITDAKGEAQFELPNPAPAYFYVRAVLSEPHWDCTCVKRVSTEEVLQKGFVMVSPYAERWKPKPIQPKSGEVLFAVRPLPLWVRFFWPLVKG
jgi:hypothetical protein